MFNDKMTRYTKDNSFTAMTNYYQEWKSRFPRLVDNQLYQDLYNIFINTIGQMQILLDHIYQFRY